MATELRLPLLAESMTTAKISAWLKSEGEWVDAGEPLLEVETEKTTVEVEAPASGVVRQIHAAAGGQPVAVGALLATIDASAPRKTPVGAPPAAEPLAPPTPSAVMSSAAESLRHVVESIAAPAMDAAHTLLATPLARRMALLSGIDLSQVRASAPDGRVRKVDIEQILKGRAPATTTVAVPVAPMAPEQAPGSVPYEDRPLTPARRVTAARLLQSKQTVPHFYLRVECRVDAILDIRSKVSSSDVGVKPTITDFTVKAAAMALKQVPAANSSWVENGVRVYEHAEVAVAVNTPAGLFTPIVRKAETKPLAAISRELSELVERARAGRLSPNEYTGGTFTISNLGMYGVESLYAIVNPPQSCILGVGAAEERPIVQEGRLAIGTMMTCTLSADHRAIDGATGAEFLAAFKALIEDPWFLLL